MARHVGELAHAGEATTKPWPLSQPGVSVQLGMLLLYVIRVGTSLSLGTLEKARAPPTAARRRSFEAIGQYPSMVLGYPP